MQNTFEEIRRQIHEIRNFLAPFDLKLAVLDERIAESRAFFEQKIGRTESSLLENSFNLEKQGLTIMDLLERVNWIELVMKIPPVPARANPCACPSPAREDKKRPEILPPQKPEV